jgi:hypothetical protein
MLAICALSTKKDLVKWMWEESDTFSVKSMYNHLFSLEVNNPKKKLWEAKIPMKIKIFVWLIDANAILTKDNLSRKNWQGDKRCFFCNIFESVVHLFFDCYMARYIWTLIAYIVGVDCRPSSFDQFWKSSQIVGRQISSQIQKDTFGWAVSNLLGSLEI